MPTFHGKILIVKLSALGDVIASTGLITQLKKENPECTIKHLVMSQCKIVTQNLEQVDEVIEIPLIPSGNIIVDIKNTAFLLLKLMNERFDIAIILHRSILLQVICKIAGIKRLIGYKTKASILLSEFAEFSMIGNRSVQEVVLVKKAKLISREPERLSFQIDEARINFDKLKFLPNNFIVINPGGGNPHAPAINKQWPENLWVKFINQCPLQVVMIGNGNEDQVISDKISKKAMPFINLVNKTNLHESAFILKKSSVYVGNDSAMLYLAAAIGGVRCIGLYGPTNASAFKPLGANQISIQGESFCSPCYSSMDGIKGRMYTCSDNICMKSISVEQVLQYTEKYLNE